VLKALIGEELFEDLVNFAKEGNSDGNNLPRAITSLSDALGLSRRDVPNATASVTLEQLLADGKISEQTFNLEKERIEKEQAIAFWTATNAQCAFDNDEQGSRNAQAQLEKLYSF
jgi:hypothetical protein